MVNLKSMEKEKNEIIRNMSEKELEEYYKLLIANLYEGFITQDNEKALESKFLIEEATSIYKQNPGYEFIDRMEYHLRLKEANNQLVKTLEEKNDLNISFSEHIFINAINMLSSYNYVLETLLGYYRKQPSEELVSIIKDILLAAESEADLNSFLLDIDLENNIYSSEMDLLKSSYSDFEVLSKEIKNL